MQVSFIKINKARFTLEAGFNCGINPELSGEVLVITDNKLTMF